MIHKTIGDRLKYSLELRNMTQKELADKIGVTEISMSRYVNSTREPRADKVILICRTLGISSDWLLGLLG